VSQGGFLGSLGVGGGMLELVLAAGTLLAALAVLWLVWMRTAEIDTTLEEIGGILKVEGDFMKENMNHIASALIGLSELLDSADDLIEDAQRIPSMGEVLATMVQSLIVSKLSSAVPQLSPLIENAALIGQTEVEPEHAAAQGETETTQ